MQKRWFLLMTMLMLMQLNAFSQKKSSNKIFPYPIHQKQLKNGLNVVTVPYSSPGLAAFYIVVRVGSREEVEAGKTGFAHFFEHMMFRGTDKYSKEEYNEILKSIGAAANANTSIDRTVYHMTGNSNMLEKMFELEADRFQNLKYTVHDFKTEAGAVKGEYTKNSASPFTQIYEKTVETAFDKHTYKHTTMGFFKDVVDMPNQYDYSLEFFKRFYKPEYTTIIVVGDAKAENVNKLAEKYFGKWKKGSYKPEIPKEPEQTETRFAHIKNANFPPYLGLNYKGPAFDMESKDVAALDIILNMLFADNSDLYQKLVVKEQKARTLNGYATHSRDPHLISISATLVKAEDLQYVKDEISKALNELKTQTVDAKKLSDTKSNIKYSFAMSLDSPDRIANSLSRFVWLTGKPETIESFYARYATVTQEDVMRVAKKYFDNKKLTISTISAKEEGGIK